MSCKEGRKEGLELESKGLKIILVQYPLLLLFIGIKWGVELAQVNSLCCVNTNLRTDLQLMEHG